MFPPETSPPSTTLITTREKKPPDPLGIGTSRAPHPPHIAGYERFGSSCGLLLRRHKQDRTTTELRMINAPPQVIAGIEYSVCRPEDTSEIGRVLAESFTQHDPPAVAVGLNPGEFEAFVELWSPAAGVDGLTIIARDVATRQLAGALLTDDAASPPPLGLDEVSEKFDPIFDLLAQIDAEYRDGRTIEPGQCLHLFLLGVAGQFTRRRIGQHLVGVCLANGADRGYTSAVTEATNPVSQHIFGQLGFQKRAERSYSEYRLDGSPIFTSISQYGGPMTMDRTIST
jgi:ribosomal protein S18 acetylase RimI-like enzyme